MASAAASVPLAEAAHPPVRFVILAAPRTGSNWLCTLLDSHPAVLCHHEVFNPAGIHLARSRRQQIDLGSVAARDRDRRGTLERLWRLSFGCHAVGFKVTREQPAAVFETVFADAGIRVLVLRRRHRLRTYLSERLAEETGRWESYLDHPGDRAPRTASGLPPVAITATGLAAHAARNERYYAWLAERLRAAGHAVLTTTYEELPRLAEQRRILRFLGVDPGRRLVAGTSKQGPRALREAISNFDTLSRDLEGGPFAAELAALDLPRPRPRRTP